MENANQPRSIPEPGQDLLSPATKARFSLLSFSTQTATVMTNAAAELKEMEEQRDAAVAASESLRLALSGCQLRLQSALAHIEDKHMPLTFNAPSADSSEKAIASALKEYERLMDRIIKHSTRKGV